MREHTRHSKPRRPHNPPKLTPLSSLGEPMSANQNQISLLFLPGGKAAEVDRCDADLQAFRWFAQTFRSGSYANRRITENGKRRRLYLSRVVAERMGIDPSLRVDHINGDTLDNRRCNLRGVDASVNARNTDKLAGRNTSGYRGVGFYPRYGRWRAHIRVGGKLRSLGYFETAEAANAARLTAERELWGIEPRRAEAHGL